LSDVPAIRCWEEFAAGMSVGFEFTVSQEDMDRFRDFSGDSSRIHVDETFARRNGFQGPVVYGAVMVAKLSYLVGMQLPGDLGLATEWKINFNNPLYVEERAAMRGEIAHVSAATRTIRLRFSIHAGGRLIASGTAGSKLLEP
jgi:3-hydroxybutyryl-CoA dehydratase